MEQDEKSHHDQESSDALVSKPTYLPAESLPDVRKKHQQDMYKVMDGSALMALGLFISYFLCNPLMVVAGMLVQDHVARLVRGKAPDRWEEEPKWGVDESRADEAGGSGLDKASDEEIDEPRSRIAGGQPNDAAGISGSGGALEPEMETSSNDGG